MELTKFRSQLSIASEQVSVGLQRAQNTVARLRAGTSDTLQKARARSENCLHTLRAASRRATAFAGARITEFKLQLSSASKRVATPVQRAQNLVSRFGRSAVDSLQKVRLEAQNDLQKLHSASRDAVVFAGGQIAKLGPKASGAIKHAGVRIHLAQNRVTTLVKSVAEKPRRLRDARRAKENELHNLVSGSLDAIVVTDVKHCLVEANPRALDLFGISEWNLKYFTIDTFIARYEPLADANSLPVSNQLEIHGRCRIRRLDGALRVAECHFVPDVVPRRHLYEFLNIAPYKISPFGFDARKASFARRTKFARHGVPFVR